MMKTYWLIVSLFFVAACYPNNDISTSERILNKVHMTEFQSILDSVQLNGSILILDPEANTVFSNNFEWAHTGKLPASTFKIPNSIIGLETGVIKNDSTIFKWDDKKRALKNWEQDLVLKDAFQFSCVPCYQSVARDIGTKRMSDYLEKLNYGTMVFDTSSIDMFWLEGYSKINQFEQIDFLVRLNQSVLAISKRTEQILKSIMVMEHTEEYTIYGKTGWAVRDETDNGWFVGFVKAKAKTYYFATNVEPQEKFNMDLFPTMRKEVTFLALSQMAILD